jgi:two-component system, chemotaxis family, CheB/CheR fusion protein
MEQQSPPEGNTNSQEKIAEHAKEHRKLFPVVAIGASAGGLEALSSFLQHVPDNLGLVYIVIQHLSPNHESILPELLERRTTMPVYKVANEMSIQPNHVYVIPPDHYMSIVDSKLTLSSRFRNGGNHSVDFFMMALATVYQNLAIGVVLSGTGTDGTEGIKNIKAEGGITFAQDETARFQGMPRNAIESGLIDFILSPEGIANELVEIVKEPYGVFQVSETEDASFDAEMKKIQAILHNRKGVDFSFYKQTTIKRRILRRMSLKRLTTLNDYTRLLRNDAAELDMLYRDLLINVTSFFREPTVYQALFETIFPAIFANRKPNDPIRIWCPACASGEEASSIAICLFEYLKEKAINTPIVIFGTDLNETAIEKARSGLYSASALQNVSPQRLKKFFVKTDGKYQIIKAVRDVCIFAVQNLLKDPPFSRIDLISCQNVMIYLETEPQRKILQSFHYGLKPAGYLLLGKSESIGNATELFAQADRDLKIYTKKQFNDSKINFDFVQIKPVYPADTEMIAKDDNNFAAREEMIDVEKESERLLLSRYVPASIVINSDFHIFRFHGPVYKYLQPTSGKASLHLLKMVRDELVYELRSLVHRIKKEGVLVRKEGIILISNGETLEVSIEVVPVKSTTKEAYYLILFEEKPNAEAGKIIAGKTRAQKPGAQQDKIKLLEFELKEAREQMKTMTEEFEATREELQSANEEILSANEELQSINEELETSKEELQSTNEELTTINEELQIRNNDLKESIDYSLAIVETIREPLLLLNADLRIRTANRAFYSTFKTAIQYVEGQFLYEIDNGQWNVPELLSKLSDIGTKRKGFVTFELNQIFKNRILLFNATHLEPDSKKRDRILLTVQDITLERQARETKEWLAAVVASSGEGIVSFGTNRIIISWNKACEKIFGYTADEMIGRSISKLTRPEDKQVQSKIIERVMKGEVVRQHETIWLHKDGRTIHITISVSSILDERGNIEGLTINIQDISEKKKAEENLKTVEQSLQVALEAVNMGVWEMNLIEKTYTHHSLRHDQLFGYETLQPDWNIEMARHYLLDADTAQFDEAFARMMETGRLQVEVRVKWPDGNTHWIQLMGRLFYNTEGRGVRAAGIVMDITERKVMERQKEAFIGIASHELKTPVTSIKAYAQILHAQFIEDNNLPSANMLEKLDRQVDRLTNLIRDLLDVTQITEGQLKLHTEETNLNELVNEVAEDMQRSAARHQIVKELQPLPTIIADKERISQVITNLVSNAIKYSPQADSVIIRTTTDGEKITVSVEDFGIGMSQDAQQKVFERFFRANELKTSTFPGLGLGLYISNEIIKRHKGKIGVSSKEGLGSTFYFSLPIST